MEHLRVLDGFRAIAVLIVIVSHADLGHIVPGGIGVTLFFFLSGYLITTLMVVEQDKSAHISLRGFYLRRTVRIIPPMLVCIAFTLLLTRLGIQPKEIRSEGLIWDFLFLSNYAPLLGTFSNIPIPLWSLAVEEHFYLLFPFIFIFAGKWGGRSGIVAVVLTLIVLVLATRIVTYDLVQNPGNMYYWSHTRIDSILYGCLLALVNNPVLRQRVYLDGRVGFFLAGVLLLLVTLVLRDDWFRQTIRYSLQGVALFLIFNYSLRSEGLVARILGSKYFVPTANYSYVLYLIHLPLLLSASQLELPKLAQNVTGILAAFLFAAISYRFIEQPLQKWRKSYQRRLALPPGIRPKGVE